MGIIKNISLLLLAIWLGAAVFFSVVLAPAAFSVLRGYQVANSSEIAGAIVNRALSVINISGFVIGLLALLTVLTLKRDYGQRAFLLEIASLAVLAVATGIGQWVIAARMRALRATLNLPIDQIPLVDARRIAFNTLHGYSVAALSVAMIATLLAILLMMNHSHK